MNQPDTPTEFKPFVPAETKMREFTFPAVITGTLLGLVFAGSSLYLVLKIGMTVSASIPVAVLAITLFKAFSRAFGLRQATILENNVTQTAGSAGESIAFGVGVTMPALMMLGFNMELGRVMVVSVLGGILGILAMIPLRRAFIVKMHGKPGERGTLLFPEGTACAQVLISGEKGGSAGKLVFFGFGIAFLHKLLVEGMALLTLTVKLPLTFINKAAVVSQDMASELLGVGYIIGLRTSAMMMGGAVLGYLVIIPLIYFIGEHSESILPPGKKPISEMTVKEIRDGYLLFIGAGCVATAGIISMLKTLPMIIRGLVDSLRGAKGGTTEGGPVKRTDNDMSMKVVLFGSLGLVVLLAVFLAGQVDPVKAVLGAGLVVVFGFLFVTVSSRLTGEIGSSSNPISGMTIATLMLTCLIFVSLGMTSVEERVLALCVAAVVCVASSNGGSTAQSLKTGFLVGGTPKAGQYAILVGALLSALVIGGTLILLNNAQTVYSQRPDVLPAVTLMPEEVARLKQSEKYQGVEYAIFDPRNEEITKPVGNYVPRPEVAEVSEGRYLVERDTGKIRYLKDPYIMGKLERNDDGNELKRIDAPKTQLMSIVINGVLKQELNWSMVGLGAMIAVMLELCGVSALAFAVGLYVSIQYSTPIFLGGIVRYLVDKKFARDGEAAIKAAGNDPEKKAAAEIEALRKTETSGGVLLASGYIAGGSIAGVLITFLSFSDNWPGDLAQYEHGKVPIGKVATLEQAADDYAQQRLGYDRAALEKEIAAQPPKPKDAAKPEPKDKDGKPLPKTVEKKPELSEPEKKLEALNKLRDQVKELSENEPYRWVIVKAGTVLKVEGVDPLVVETPTTIGQVTKDLYNDDKPDTAKQIAELNAVKLGVKEGDDPKTVPIPANTELKIPKRFKVENDTPLPDLARQLLGRERKAPQLFKSNATVLQLPKELPAEALLTKPQPEWPSIVIFAGLMVLLLLVGLRTPKEETTERSEGGEPGA